MSTTTVWMIFTLMVQLGAQLMNPRGFQRGKLFTMPLREKMPRMFNHALCRLAQIFLILIPIEMFLSFFIGNLALYLYFSMVIALSLDDYLTNDDNFKKWWMTARNKIKWKMKLPNLQRLDRKWVPDGN